MKKIVKKIYDAIPRDIKLAVKKVLPEKYKGSIHKFLTIYPIDIPEVEIKPDLDFLLLELPARHALMPNGLGYVHEALGRCGIRFQTVDLNVLLYHQFQSRRFLEKIDRLVTPGGYTMSSDPWDYLTIDEWQRSEVVDYFIDKLSVPIEKIIEKAPRAIGLSVHYNNRLTAKKFMETVRRRLPETIFVLGGYDCSNHVFPASYYTDADYIVLGEAEIPLPPLVTALAKGEKPHDLPGILSRFDSPGREAPSPMPVVELDQIEFPRYDWIDLSLYRNFVGHHQIHITATRGCNWGRCRFCPETTAFRARSSMNVVDEIQYFMDRGYVQFTFNDNNAAGDHQLLYDICSEIMARDLHPELTGQIRIDRRNTREFLSHIYKAGFKGLNYGVDAWSKNTLRLQRKGYNFDLVIQNLRDSHEVGITNRVNMVVGVPGETEEDVDESIENILKCKDYIDLFDFIHPLALPVGCEYYNNPEKNRIRFRGDKDEIYKQRGDSIPQDLWYSEEPYIDLAVKEKRKERIFSALKKHDIDTSDFLTYTVHVIREKQCK
jgi:radical SAM superfamily enzyme YgiQ (UPF0313 family)